MVVNPVINPTVTITTLTQTICAASMAEFTATAANAGSSVSYHWKINQVNAGPDNPVFSTTGLKDGDIVNCIVTTTNACATTNIASSNALTMTVNPLVSASVTITANANAVCEGTNITFTASSVNGGPSPQYTWTINGNNISTANTNVFSSATFNDKDLIACSIKSNASCLLNASGSSNTVILSITPMPTIVIQASSTVVCEGMMIDFIANGTNLGNMPTYQWRVNGNNSGSNSNVFSTGALGNTDKITCIVTAGTLCNAPMASNSISVRVNKLPTVKLDPIQIVVKGHSIQFSPVVSSDVTSYKWSPSSGLNLDNIPDPVASPTLTTIYKLSVSTIDDCEVSANCKVIVLDQVNAPNVFSPNGDGINDTWLIPGLSSYPGCTVSVYNRGGQIVYQSKGYDKPWDGSFNGKGVPIGTYYYIINPKNGFGQITGSVTVIR